MKQNSTFEAPQSPDPRRDREAILLAYTESLQTGDLHAQDELRAWVAQQPDAEQLLPLLDDLEEAWGAELEAEENDGDGG